MKYYLYQIRNKTNGMIYIGVHCSKSIKDRYMGSGTRIKEVIKKEGIENFEKSILEFFENKEDMLQREKEIVNEDFIKREDTYNLIKGGGFNTTGTTPVKDKYGNIFQVNKNDPRYLSGELVSYNKGTVLVKDINNKIFRVDINDPRYLSGELVNINKGKTTLKDKHGNIIRVDINDPRFLSGELVGLTKNIKREKGTWSGKTHSEETKALMRKNRKGKQSGSKNSQFGKFWITNGKENKKVSTESEIPKGWNKGRKIK